MKWRVEVQGQIFWVVSFQVRKGVSFQVKEWDLGRRRELILRIDQDKGGEVSGMRKGCCAQGSVDSLGN